MRKASAQDKLASSLKSAIESIKDYRESLFGIIDTPTEKQRLFASKTIYPCQ